MKKSVAARVQELGKELEDLERTSLLDVQEISRRRGRIRQIEEEIRALLKWMRT